MSEHEARATFLIVAEDQADAEAAMELVMTLALRDERIVEFEGWVERPRTEPA